MINEHEKSLEVFEKLFDFNPDNYELLVDIGITLNLLKRYKNCEEWFDNISDKFKDDIGILSLRAKNLISLKEYEKSLILYDDILGIDPENKEALLQKGTFLFKFNQDFWSRR
jgi:tetratricopeptide (TPR) repeat protein